MKKVFTFLTIFVLGMGVVFSQTVSFKDINKTHIDLSSSTVLGQVTINAPTAGKAIVHFNGMCIPDPGDKIVLAASNDNAWHVNDGCVTVEAVDDDVNTRPFSHTRVYDVTPGNHTFYAIGHNYVETAGDGEASIYGCLTVEFIPQGNCLVAFEGIQKTHVDLSSSTVLGQVAINPTTAGKAIVHFDGLCVSDPGDRIVLAASNTDSWSANGGNIGVEALDDDIDENSFSHTRVYDVTPGNHTFYAIGHNFVETAGDGEASIYGSLTVEFIPQGDCLVAFEGVQKTHINLEESIKVLKQLSLNVPTAGKAIVHFDGQCISEPGDRIILAASNVIDYGVNNGHVGVEAVDDDVNRNSFSHTRVYDVTPGNYTFYAIGHNYVETAGGGEASIYGSLVVKFFPNSQVFVNDLEKTSWVVYPNPTSDVLFIESEIYEDVIAEILDCKGQVIRRISLENYKTAINTEALSSGVYFVKIVDNGKSSIQRFVKN